MKRALATAAVVVLFAGAFTLGLTLTRDTKPAPRAAPVPRAHRAPRPIDQVRRELLSEYYRSVPASVLRRRTIRGMLASLGDPYTDYLTAAEYAELRNRTESSYGGVGLTVSPGKTGLIVTAARRGPARAAGIRPGDLIVKIDGRAVSDLSFERSLSLVKGEEGTVVKLTIERANAGRKDFRIVRDEIPVASIRSRLLRARKQRLGYVRLLAFPQGAAERLEAETDALVARGAKGLVLDLRENPGGLLDQAVRTVSLFVEDGIVCTTDGIHQTQRVFSASGDAAYPSLPLVVLVDRKSASAAEIVAAALRENRRATVVGLQTYGKGSVQSIRLLSNGGAFKLTTATYRTPAGHDLHLTGVRPDIRARDKMDTKRDEALLTAERALLDRIG